MIRLRPLFNIKLKPFYEIFFFFKRLSYISNPLIAKQKKYLNTVYTAIAVCIIIGLFWATLPLFGWSFYSLEGAQISCSVEWNEKSFNVVSYNISIFGLVFLVPFAFILANSYALIFLVIINKVNLKKSSFWHILI